MPSFHRRNMALRVSDPYMCSWLKEEVLWDWKEHVDDYSHGLQEYTANLVLHSVDYMASVKKFRRKREGERRPDGLPSKCTVEPSLILGRSSVMPICSQILSNTGFLTEVTLRLRKSGECLERPKVSHGPDLAEFFVASPRRYELCNPITTAQNEPRTMWGTDPFGWPLRNCLTEWSTGRRLIRLAFHIECCHRLWLDLTIGKLKNDFAFCVFEESYFIRQEWCHLGEKSKRGTA